jgi:hypothetical protein
MSAEVWRAIPGATRYEVSDQGRVRSLRRAVPHVMAAYMNNNGYIVVPVVTDAGVVRYGRAHQYVLEAFVGPQPSGQEVRHLDGNRSHNHVSNLRWGTRSENARDMLRHGTHNQASKTHCPQGHPYAGSNLMLDRKGWRICRACSSASKYAYKARLRAACAAAKESAA